MSFSFACRYNSTYFGIDTREFIYVKLQSLYGERGSAVVGHCDGLYLHTSQINTAPVLIDASARQLVNLPAHMTPTVEEILGDPEAIKAIKDGRVGYTIYEYESHGRKCYSIRFVDL